MKGDWHGFAWFWCGKVVDRVDKTVIIIGL